MSEKVRYPAALAGRLATKIVEVLRPFCQRIEVAGSLRRRKAEVGDIEILYIPRMTRVRNPEALFGDELIELNAVDLELAEMLKEGSLEKRLNVNGSPTWGAEKKLARAVKTGIPVDFFATTEKNWFNYLVCRTGGAESNMEIASAAKRQGFKWNSCGSGFTQTWGTGETKFVVINSEREVFQFVGLPYKEPWER